MSVVEFNSVLLVTAIITLGPACQDVDTLSQMLEAGATCARSDLTVSLA